MLIEVATFDIPDSGYRKRHQPKDAASKVQMGAHVFDHRGLALKLSRLTLLRTTPAEWFLLVMEDSLQVDFQSLPRG